MKSLALLLLASAAAVAESRADDLMQLYIKAIEFDPEFQRARIERQASFAAVDESKAALGPAVSASAEGSKNFQDTTRSTSPLFPLGARQFYDSSYSLSLSQPIYRRDLIARMPQARADLRKSEALFTAAEQDLLFRVSQTHFQFLAARESLDFSRAEGQAIAGQLLEARERLSSGLGTVADLHDLEGRAALAEAAEIDAQDAVEEARQAIAEITGEAPAELKRLSDAFPLVPPADADVATWVSTAMFSSPRVQAVQADIDSAEQEIRRQRGLYLPGFDLFASYSLSDAGGSVYGAGNRIASTQAGLRLSIPLYDGGRAVSRVEQAELRKSAAYQELEKERRRAEREARAAFQGVASGLTRIQALTKSVFAHEAAVAVKEQGWRSGINTGLIVLDARKELYQAKRDLAQARYLYLLQGLKLKQAAGTLAVDDLRRINAYLQ
ncbi:MAG: TolC family outer membrane protein [Acidobacteria bacterium]|nr:TolC family outer membrane protein [Acidobacteriota bacterium]